MPLPSPDVVEAAAKAGITAIIQPGFHQGSDSIDCCNQYDIAMVFTHMRHFNINGGWNMRVLVIGGGGSTAILENLPKVLWWKDLYPAMGMANWLCVPGDISDIDFSWILPRVAIDFTVVGRNFHWHWGGGCLSKKT